MYERRGREPVRAVAGASLDRRARPDRRPRRRVGLRQVTPRARGGRDGATGGGSVRFEGARREAAHAAARPRELARLQMVFQNPFSSLNPRRKVGAQLGDALALLGLARRAGGGGARRGAARAGRPPPRPRPLASAPVLGRSAPADRDRAGARGRTVGDRARRAARLARRLGAGADREPPRRPLAPALARPAAHLPRPRDRPARRRRRSPSCTSASSSRRRRRSSCGRCRSIRTPRR